jgi:hypothetical protein
MMNDYEVVYDDWLMKLFMMSDYEVVYDDWLMKLFMMNDYEVVYDDWLWSCLWWLISWWCLCWRYNATWLLLWYVDDMMLYDLWYDMLMKFKLLSVIDELYA